MRPLALLAALALLGCSGDGFEIGSGATDAAIDSTVPADTAAQDTAIEDSDTRRDSAANDAGGAPDTLVVPDAVITPDAPANPCDVVVCIGTQRCCPKTGTCYDPKCLACCMSG